MNEVSCMVMHSVPWRRDLGRYVEFDPNCQFVEEKPPVGRGSHALSDHAIHLHDCWRAYGLWMYFAIIWLII